MRAQGTVRVSAAREDVWRRLSDPRLLEEALPAVDAVELDGDDAFNAWVAPATGLGVTPLRVFVSIRDRREGEHVRLEGTGRGPEYAAAFTVDLDFRSEDGGTAVAWSAEAKFGGVIGSLGQRVLPSILGEQVERVVRASAAR